MRPAASQGICLFVCLSVLQCDVKLFVLQCDVKLFVLQCDVNRTQFLFVSVAV